MAGKLVVANFTEDSVALAIEMYLSVFSFPNLRYSVVPFSKSKERWLGADARLFDHVHGFLPFYMQFKRPSAYPDSSTAGVVKDRRKLIGPAAVTPHSLFFKLLDKQPKHSDYQHNVLYRLRQRVKLLGGDAAYVCPLFVDRAAYVFNMHAAAMRHGFAGWRQPWDSFDPAIHGSSWTLRFTDVPLLAEHVTIPPHAPVTNADHKYSFTELGEDVCFHSPQALPDGATRLSDWLYDIGRRAAGGQDLINSRNAYQKMNEFVEGLDLPKSDFLGPPGYGVQEWMEMGDYLRREFQIEQYAFVVWRDDKSAQRP